jgi:histidinol-phosphate/aromatic aminotransferase/cobyric acid decarboxylase-like protein
MFGGSFNLATIWFAEVDFACGDVARVPHSVSLAVADGAWAGAQLHRSLVWLKAHLDERTAIIYLVDPNNPLGIRYTGE